MGNLLDGLANLAVVDRVVQLVGLAGVGQINVQGDVDLDRLGGLALVIEHADDRHQAQTT